MRGVGNGAPFRGSSENVPMRKVRTSHAIHVNPRRAETKHQTEVLRNAARRKLRPWID
jgi:hypothetical protein